MQPLDIWNLGNGQYWILDATTDEWYFIVRVGRNWGWLSNGNLAVGREGLRTLKATKDDLAAYVTAHRQDTARVQLTA
jgi:hypothetical protein